MRGAGHRVPSPSPSGRDGGTLVRSRRCSLASSERLATGATALIRAAVIALLVVLAVPAAADIDVSVLRREAEASRGESAAGGDESSRPSDAEVWYRRALELDKQGAPRQALGEAARLYQLAADHGHTDAQTNLAIMYRDGHGVARNEAEALRWFERAARANNARAQYSLGLMHHQGIGTARDPAEAAYWYESAARRGHANAMNNLAILYGTGEGVAQSNVEAYAWFAMAARHGDANAAENRDITAQEMSAEEREEAVARVERLGTELGL